MILYNGWGKPFLVRGEWSRWITPPSAYEWIVPGTYEAFE